MKVIVTSVRNEAPWMLEWIAYHLALGFDYFLIYTNDNTDESWQLFDKLQQRAGYEIHDNPLQPGESPQKKAFSRAFKRLVELQPEWIACLDPDEYINLKQHASLDEFLSAHANMDAIAINWRFFGSSGLANKGMGFTTERFLQCSKANFFWNRVFKTLFRFSPQVTGFGPHRPWYKSNYQSTVKYCFPSGFLVPPEYIKPKSPLQDPKAYIEHDIAQINHYAIRSRQEYAIKRDRGNGMKPNDPGQSHFVDDYFTIRDQNQQTDSSILRLLPQQKQIYLDLVQSLELHEWVFATELKSGNWIT